MRCSTWETADSMSLQREFWVKVEGRGRREAGRAGLSACPTCSKDSVRWVWQATGHQPILLAPNFGAKRRTNALASLEFAWQVLTARWSPLARLGPLLCGRRAALPGILVPMWLWVKTNGTIGAPPILVYFSGDWDVHWGVTGVLTHGHVAVDGFLSSGIPQKEFSVVQVQAAGPYWEDTFRLQAVV